jgi:phospholipid-binding lipoprotein MlaA
MAGLPPKSRANPGRSTPSMIRLRIVTLAFAGAIASGAGAQTAPSAGAAATDHLATQPVYDPFGPANRGSFKFSLALDRALIGPIAHGYMAVTPRFFQARVSAVIYNLGEPGTTLNDVLQVRPGRAARSGGRFVINSTLGLLGLFDVASGMGVAAHDADFGQTLGRYGLQAGPYLYVPVLGPMDVRDGFGRVVDFLTDPVSIAAGGNYKTTFNATRLGVTLLDTRVRTDGAFLALDDATDPYASARSAYTQHREAFVSETTGQVQALPDFDTPGSPQQ